MNLNRKTSSSDTGSTGQSRLSRSAEINRRLYEKWMFADSILAPQSGYLEGSLFANYGYWEEDTNSSREACENLMDNLLDMLSYRQGKVLDVACGLGATSRHLAKHFGPENVTTSTKS